MMKIIICTTLCCLSLFLSAQQYSIVFIPDSLVQNANAIKRVDEHVLDIRNKGKATYKYKTAYTILNEKADYLSHNTERYDKFVKIGTIEANLYDAAGAKIKTLKKADIQDLSGQGGGTEISDDRVKAFGFYHKQYPYTIEFEVSVDYDGLMFLPAHYFYESSDMALQQSSYQVIFPADAPVLYKAYNYPGAPLQNDVGGKKTLKWELKNKPAVVSEYYAPPWYEITPSVFLAMETFEMEGYNGSNRTWEDFGSFVYQLKKNRDKLPVPLVQKVHEIADAQPDQRSKVEALYKYMQENTRYISVQLGIGGWQPFDAKYVYERKYGDCKALTNYMHALLKEAGINSDYALIKSGRGVVRFKPDFPSSQFDHVILAVPLQNDTMWLECTSQTSAAGYLGDFTNGRPALLVKEKGSVLVNTPDYLYYDNKQIAKSVVDLAADGKVKVNIDIVYTGMQYDSYHDMVKQLSEAEIKNKLQDRYRIGTYTVDDYRYEELAQMPPAMREKIVIAGTAYAQRTGKRLFIAPNIINKTNNRPDKDTSRQHEVVITFPYYDIDTVTIKVPEGFKPESIPAAQKIESAFGTYSMQPRLENGNIVYTREMIVRKGRHAPSAYNDFVKWYADIYKADNARVVLVLAE